MKIFTFKIPSDQPFDKKPIVSENSLKKAVSDLLAVPKRFKEVVAPMTDKELDTKTEKGIWTVRQVVHHTADSHINAFIRFKFALTMDKPEIMPYPEPEWAKFPDTLNSPVEYSLNILSGIHQRWADTLSALSLEELNRSYYHPADKEHISIGLQVPLYIWHANYHLGFIMRTLL
ncbi:MAG: putative metal-dependent hydrolase [Spirochaetia bacterium]|nr:putative metal-dependent hydrolase [Spirochaetia bacterium]